jgi:hypothetical protein
MIRIEIVVEKSEVTPKEIANYDALHMLIKSALKSPKEISEFSVEELIGFFRRLNLKLAAYAVKDNKNIPEELIINSIQYRITLDYAKKLHEKNKELMGHLQATEALLEKLLKQEISKEVIALGKLTAQEFQDKADSQVNRLASIRGNPIKLIDFYADHVDLMVAATIYKEFQASYQKVSKELAEQRSCIEDMVRDAKKESHVKDNSAAIEKAQKYLLINNHSAIILALRNVSAPDNYNVGMLLEAFRLGKLADSIHYEDIKRTQITCMMIFSCCSTTLTGGTIICARNVYLQSMDTKAANYFKKQLDILFTYPQILGNDLVNGAILNASILKTAGLTLLNVLYLKLAHKLQHPTEHEIKLLRQLSLLRDIYAEAVTEEELRDVFFKPVSEEELISQHAADKTLSEYKRAIAHVRMAMKLQPYKSVAANAIRNSIQNDIVSILENQDLLVASTKRRLLPATILRFELIANAYTKSVRTSEDYHQMAIQACEICIFLSVIGDSALVDLADKSELYIREISKFLKQCQNKPYVTPILEALIWYLQSPTHIKNLAVVDMLISKPNVEIKSLAHLVMLQRNSLISYVKYLVYKADKISIEKARLYIQKATEVAEYLLTLINPDLLKIESFLMAIQSALPNEFDSGYVMLEVEDAKIATLLECIEVSRNTIMTDLLEQEAKEKEEAEQREIYVTKRIEQMLSSRIKPEQSSSPVMAAKVPAAGEGKMLMEVFFDSFKRNLNDTRRKDALTINNYLTALIEGIEGLQKSPLTNSQKLKLISALNAATFAVNGKVSDSVLIKVQGKITELASDILATEEATDADKLLANIAMADMWFTQAFATGTQFMRREYNLVNRAADGSLRLNRGLIIEHYDEAGIPYTLGSRRLKLYDSFFVAVEKMRTYVDAAVALMPKLANSMISEVQISDFLSFIFMDMKKLLADVSAHSEKQTQLR